MFSLTVTFYLTKSKKQNQKNNKHSSRTIALSESKIFAKKSYFLLKNADMSKIKRVLKGIFSETTYVFVLTYQISSF